MNNRRLCYDGRRAFTLIELLVVIAIIGILASIILAAVSSARTNALDARRISDIKDIQEALELYANDHGYAYPGPAQDPNSHGNGLGALAPTYMSSVPTDPTTGQSYYYAAFGSGLCETSTGAPNATAYHLGAVLQNSNNPALASDPHTGKAPGTCTGDTDFYGNSNGCGSTASSPITCYDVHS